MPKVHCGQVWFDWDLLKDKVATTTVCRGDTITHLIKGFSHTRQVYDVRVSITFSKATNAHFNGTLEFEELGGATRSDSWLAFLADAAKKGLSSDAARLIVSPLARIADAEIIAVKVEFRGKCPNDPWRNASIQNPQGHELTFSVT